MAATKTMAGIDGKMEGDDLWDGFDFDTTKDIDWGAMDMTEEECLAINFPTGLVGKCSSFESVTSTEMDTLFASNNNEQQNPGKRRLSIREDEQLDKAAKHECFSRILATTRVASSHWEGEQKATNGFCCSYASTLTLHSPDLLAVTELRKTISMKLLGALNQGDMDRLALLIHDYCDDYCELNTQDVTNSVIGKVAVMTLLSLMFETYPDGLYRMKQLIAVPGNDQVSIAYQFSGRNVFNQSIESLYEEVTSFVHIDALGDAMSSARIGDVMSGVSTPIGTQSSTAMEHFSETLTKLLTQKAMDVPGSLRGSRVPSRAGTGTNTPTALQTMLAVQRFSGYCSGASTPVPSSTPRITANTMALVHSSSSYDPSNQADRLSVSGGATASTKSNGSSFQLGSSVRSLGSVYSVSGTVDGVAGNGTPSVSSTLDPRDSITISTANIIGHNKTEQINGAISQSSWPIYDRFTPMEALTEKSSHSTPTELDTANANRSRALSTNDPLPPQPTKSTSQLFMGSSLPQLQRTTAFFPPSAQSSSGCGTLLTPSYYGMDPSSILARSSGTHTPNPQVQGFMSTMMPPAIAGSNSMAHLVRKGTEMLARASQVNAKRLMTIHFGSMNRITKIVVVDQ